MTYGNIKSLNHNGYGYLVKMSSTIKVPSEPKALQTPQMCQVHVVNQLDGMIVPKRSFGYLVEMVMTGMVLGVRRTYYHHCYVNLAQFRSND